MKKHAYEVVVKWTGNEGVGTKNYATYRRDHMITALGKTPIEGSSDPAFRGDPNRYNPEELFLSSLSTCHMLWYLHLCSTHGITVVDYKDNPKGIMIEDEDGSGYFESVTLFPKAMIKEEDKKEKALQLHHEANQFCFIANSVNFAVHHEAEVEIF